MKCRTCRYHYYESIDRGRVCVNPDSDLVGDWTEDDYSCNHWAPEIEQDGDATWF